MNLYRMTSDEVGTHYTHVCTCINPHTYAYVYSCLENIEIIEPSISWIPDRWRQYKSFPQTLL